MRRALATLAVAALAVAGLAATTSTADAANRTYQPYSSGGVSGQYHVFDEGIDTSKPVGLLVYTDGSAEYGLKNPSSSYLLAGSTGLIATARKHNMVLLTPLAPGGGCPDGDGTCWYQSSGGYTAAAKAKWSSDLMSHIKGQYNIDSRRIAVGGYSSGAQWTTRFFLPAHGEAQSVDLAVPISYGGAPAVTANFSSAYKAATVVSFDTGTNDSAYSSQSWGAIGGYNWYTGQGFRTGANWVQGKGHSRSGEFGPIMDREITQHIPAATGPAPTPSPTASPTPSPTVSPSPSPTATTPAPSPSPTIPDGAYPINFDGNPLIKGHFRVLDCQRIRVDLTDVPTRDHLFTRIENRSSTEHNEIFHEQTNRSAAYTMPILQWGWNKIEVFNQHNQRVGHAVAWNPCR